MAVLAYPASTPTLFSRKSLPWAASLLTATAMLAGGSQAGAQVDFGPHPVGAATTKTVSVRALATATVTSIRVVTTGTTGLDFSAVPANCMGSLIAGQQCSETVQFSPAFPGQRLGALELLDSGNNIVGVTQLQGVGVGGLGVLVPGTIQTAAGDGDWKGEGDNVLATVTELFLPSAVALDGAGNLFIADSHHSRIRLVCAGTGNPFPGVTCAQKDFIYTVANTAGNTGYAGDGLAATNSSVAMNTPSGLAIDAAGNLYIADTGNNVIRKISASTGILTTIAGNGVQGFSGDGASATAAELAQPNGVAVDVAGNVFIADSGNSRIRAVCAVGGTSILGVSCVSAGEIVTVAGSGSALNDDGQATAARLNHPYTLAFDASWNLYIADSDNQRIRAVCAAAGNVIIAKACTAAGMIQTVAGDGTKTFAGDGGPSRSASINSPSGVVIDAAGNLYIADTENFRIRKVNAATGIISTIAGSGLAGYGGDGGPSTIAGLYGPYGLALDGNGNLYIAEFLDNRVRVVQSNSSHVTVKLPIRQGSTSAPVDVTVENDGPGTLTLTALQTGTNTAYDAGTTTCTAGGILSPSQQCTVAAEFAPATTPPLSTNTPESGDITIPDETVASIAGSNSPLDILVTGTATPVNATEVTLAADKNPSLFGQSVTFSATVKTGAGTGALTGTVTFLDGATQIGSPLTVDANGAANITLSTLTVGLHSITAKYNGDAGHFANVSDPLKETVNEGTATTVSSSANPSALNANVTFTASVAATAGGGVVPVGTVTFMDGSTALATVPLAGNTAVYATAALIDGPHSITAVYSGDAGTYVLGSSSSVLTQDVLAGSTVTVISSLNPSNYGNAISFTAAVTSKSSVAPAGTVDFFDGSTKLGSAALVGNSGIATFSISTLTAGTHSISAVYSGSANSGPGTSAAIPQVVNLAQTASTLSASPTPGIAGATQTLTATVAVTAGSATVTGKVTFMDGATTLGAANVNSSGLATLDVSLAPGAHSLQAAYEGDVNDRASASPALPYTVILATTTVSLTTSGTPVQALSAVTFTAKVSGNGGVPIGNLVFSVDGTPASTAALTAGVATFKTTTLTLGSHAITAAYAGDTNDNPSNSNSLTQVIDPIPTVTDIGTATATGTTATQAVLVATTIGSTGPVPTGTVTFTVGTKVIGSSNLGAGGVATLVPDLPPGTYSVVASYGGDSIHSASASQPITISGAPALFSVNVTPPTLTLKSSQNGTVSVTFASIAGFTDTIGMGCLGLPQGVNCHFASPSVTIKPGQSETVQLTIDTNAPLNGGTTAGLGLPTNGSVSLAGLLLPMSVFFGCVLWRFRRRNPRLILGAILLWMAGGAGVTGCGASFSQHTVAAGSYAIQVGGVGTNSNTSHYVTVNLTVTK